MTYAEIQNIMKISQTAGLTGWSNVYRVIGVSSKNWSRQIGCKCC